MQVYGTLTPSSQIPLVERSPKASLVISHMARTPAEQTSFPDLDNWEDSAEKKRQATEAVNALRQYLAKQQESADTERERIETQGQMCIRDRHKRALAIIIGAYMEGLSIPELMESLNESD